MAMTASNGWRADELSAIDGCGEVGIATRRNDGTLRAARTVWIVRHDTYRGKYGRSSSAVARITADVARATSLRVDPA
jgi:hypothetical protein